jgi:hypothetical protein
MKPGMVIHACNPSFSGGRDQEDLLGKKLTRLSSQPVKAGCGGSCL